MSNLPDLIELHKWVSPHTSAATVSILVSAASIVSVQDMGKIRDGWGDNSIASRVELKNGESVLVTETLPQIKKLCDDLRAEMLGGEK